LHGEDYTGVTCSVVKANNVKICSCDHGRQQLFKCSTFTVADRQALHSEFYASGDFARQRDFIVTLFCKKKKEDFVSPDSFDIIYHLVTVCNRSVRKMFLTTFDIGERLVMYTLKKVKTAGNVAFSTEDRCDRLTPCNVETATTLREGVRNHISSFPPMDPHYTRADSNRQFLGADLNIKSDVRPLQANVLHEWEPVCERRGLSKCILQRIESIIPLA
jgi:hypothetical protein